MKLAVIDVGSNTIRLCVYTQDDAGQLTMLFTKKEMAGLANYVHDKELSDDGVDRCCMALEHFQYLLQQLDVNALRVFATASLRNISNSASVLTRIERRCGIVVELLSGEEESTLGFQGVLKERNLTNCHIFDIGGGSTEISLVEGGRQKRAKSFAVGSLQLYRTNVKDIWPARQELRAMHQQTLRAIDLAPYKKRIAKGQLMVGVGGSARAVLKCANIHMKRKRTEKHLTPQEFREIHDLLIKRDNTAKNLVIKACPDRMHTLLPGLCIMDTIVKALKPNEIYISRNGVREGYACKVFEGLAGAKL